MILALNYNFVFYRLMKSDIMANNTKFLPHANETFHT